MITVSKTSKTKLASLTQLKMMAKKYNVSASGSRAMIAKTISDLRGRHLTKGEIEKLKPFLTKQTKNRKILFKIHYPKAIQKASLKAKREKQRRHKLAKK
jgi:hypothetical protein